MCTVERSYPKVGVGQILKQYLNTSAVTNTFSKLSCCFIIVHVSSCHNIS